MQSFLIGDGRRTRAIALVVVLCLASFSAAQVSLSSLAKAVAETGASSPNAGGREDSHVSPGAQTSIASGTLSSPDDGSAGSTGSKNAPQLEHVAVGPTTFSGDQKFSQSGGNAPTLSSSGPVPITSSTGSGGGAMGVSAADVEALAERRELAIGVAGGAGLFFLGVWLTSHLTRSRRMSLSRHD